MNRWLLPILCALLVMPLVAMATGTLSVPINFGSYTSGVHNLSDLDANFAAVTTYINTREITQDLATNRPAAGVKGRWYLSTDANGGTLYNDTGSSWQQVAAPVNGGLAEQFTGLSLVHDTVNVPQGDRFMVRAGAASSDDTTITNRVLMILTGATTKTLGAWAVGSTNGCLDTGTVGTGTWYHVFVIERLDTSVVDVVCSTSATAPTMPANYTKKRRVGAVLTDNNRSINYFTQFGDEVWWATPTGLNVDAINPGTSAVVFSVTTPCGINTKAILHVEVENATTALLVAYIKTNGGTTDSGPSTTALPLYTVGTTAVAASADQGGQVSVWTDSGCGGLTYRLNASGANDRVRIATLGYREVLRN